MIINKHRLRFQWWSSSIVDLLSSIIRVLTYNYITPNWEMKIRVFYAKLNIKKLQNGAQ
jgi:hypothetical protein